MNEPIAGATRRTYGKVLVVEDEATAWRQMKRELEKRGMQVDIAEDAGDASRRLSVQQYDAIILDPNLPVRVPGLPKEDEDATGTNYPGTVLFENMRRGIFANQGTSSTVPVFIMTGTHTSEEKERLDRLKPECYFAKPVAAFAIAEHVKLHLEDLAHGK